MATTIKISCDDLNSCKGHDPYISLTETPKLQFRAETFLNCQPHVETPNPSFNLHLSLLFWPSYSDLSLWPKTEFKHSRGAFAFIKGSPLPWPAAPSNRHLGTTWQTPWWITCLDSRAGHDGTRTSRRNRLRGLPRGWSVPLLSRSQLFTREPLWLVIDIVKRVGGWAPLSLIWSLFVLWRGSNNWISAPGRVLLY